MKVLQVYKYYHPFIGGIENHVRTLATELVKHVEVEVLVCNTDRKTVTTHIDGIRVTKCGRLFSKMSTPFSPAFPRHLRRSRADIIHIHLANPLATAAYQLVGCNGAKMVASYHMDVTRYPRAQRLYEPHLNSFLTGAAALVAASPRIIATSPILQRHADHTVVIPYGIDLERFTLTREIEDESRAIRQKWGTSPGRLAPPLVLSCGRLTPYKGTAHLVRAMQSVRGHLAIIGEGEERARLESLVHEIGVEQRVTLMGSASDSELLAFYAACDLFVLPSVNRSEAFGIVLLEAMAMGKPVISTEVGTGTSWVNQHGITGLVVPPADSEALAKAINTLLEERELRDTMGANGRMRVEKEFTKEIMANKHLELYRNVVSGKGV